MTKDVISARDLDVTFEGVRALDGFSLDVPAGSLVALLGPSGCGKTTALRSIAGFQPVDAGTIEIRDRVVTGDGVFVPPEKRRVGMVFQEFALFPHITVAENVGYGVRGADRVQRVAETLKLVGLVGYDNRFPHELSGGEQQRVALARALAPEPDVVLLDEPFSNLDAPKREQMRRELRRIIRTAGVTAVFVTHDQAEALAIADMVAVMRKGRVVQSGTPDEVYGAPVSPWIARFLGDAVIFDGVVSHGSVTTPIGAVASELADGTPAQVMIRPEWVLPTPSPNGHGKVIDREFYGHDQRVEIRMHGGASIEALVSGRVPMRIGDTVDVEITDSIVFEQTSAIPTTAPVG
ncbi:MAG TPA: ABC transporter ATP-binding protein [Acidimicrobiia bacterium]|nr:ABC transporter ATP-binding protein [Acidimicrobiia bacterium]